MKGKPVIDKLNEHLKSRAEALRARGAAPALAIVRVGDNGDDMAYERNAAKCCEAAGVEVRLMHYGEDVPQAELLDCVRKLNEDSSVHGVLILRPLPPHIDDRAVCRALAPEKDVDGITEYSMAGLYSCKKVGFAPCTAEACIDMLDHYGVELAGKRAVVVGRSFVVGKPVAMMLLERDATAVVVGRSFVVGKPVAMMLLERDATVTVCHTKTKNLAALCREAEILVVAIGHGKMIGREYLSPGQVIVDIGINFDENGKMCGDVDYEAASETALAVTPVPGGIGKVTTAVLAKHVVEACSRLAERATKS